MNDLPRCHGRYQKDPLYLAYHDEEWGRPEHDDKKLYELFLLELFQAGLSWSCILHKRESFRNAFDGFDLHKIAAYGQRDVERLLADPSIIRSRLKILAAINNANIVLSIISEFGSFDRYLWSFTDGRTLVVDPSVTRNAASDAMAIETAMNLVASSSINCKPQDHLAVNPAALLHLMDTIPVLKAADKQWRVRIVHPIPFLGNPLVFIGIAVGTAMQATGIGPDIPAQQAVASCPDANSLGRIERDPESLIQNGLGHAALRVSPETPKGLIFIAESETHAVPTGHGHHGPHKHLLLLLGHGPGFREIPQRFRVEVQKTDHYDLRRPL